MTHAESELRKRIQSVLGDAEQALHDAYDAFCVALYSEDREINMLDLMKRVALAQGGADPCPGVGLEGERFGGRACLRRDDEQCREGVEVVDRGERGERLRQRPQPETVVGRLAVLAGGRRAPGAPHHLLVSRL